MADRLEVDSQWVVATLNTICTQVAVLPSIEQHLARQNDSIAKMQQRAQLREDRLRELERQAQAKTARWKSYCASGIKILEALIIAFLLTKVLGMS